MASAALCLRTNSPYRGIGKYSGCLAFVVSTMLYITAVAQAPASDVWNRKAFRSGLRHEMEENGRLIKFLYNEDREVVAEETGNGTITRYIRGLGIISSDSEEAKTYYHYVSDEQGSITHVLSEDAEILNHYSYDDFGNIIQKTEKVENRFCYNAAKPL